MTKSRQTENISWENLQDTLAEKDGLAIVLVDENSSVVSQSNNNSMCRALYNSHEFAPECAKYCGRAFEMAKEAGAAVEYKCYAGLNCKAVPVAEDLAAIVGRAFLKAEDYRAATERAISGDWNSFAPTAFFENVLLSGSAKKLETLAARLENLRDTEKAALEKFLGRTENKTEQTDEISKLVEQFHKTAETVTVAAVAKTAQTSEDAEETAAWRGLFGSLLNLKYEQAFRSILEFLTKRYSVRDLAWLERKANRLETIFAVGGLRARNLKISIAADDARLIGAARKDSALELREKLKRGETGEPQKIRLFPIAVGDEIGNALVVGDKIADERTKKHIARFCHSIASMLEILRLREELSRRISLENDLQKSNEDLKNQAKGFEQQAVTDALTGLLNRRYLMPRLEEEIKRSNRNGDPLSFILIDVDDFGKFNKDFGLQTGDEVLQRVVKAMTAGLRGEDVAARYGGEEFCVLLPQTNLKEAVSIAERMRQAVEKIDFPQRRITISLGVTSFSHSVLNSEAIIKTADEALRNAKQGGKNNVQVYG